MDRIANTTTNGRLTLMQRETLEAVAQRVLPTDSLGPGAGEAGAAAYVERALSGPYASHLDVYREGLAAIEAAAATHGGDFAALPEAAQDEILIGLERSQVAGERDFFELIRAHIIEGMFGDPAWGGNAGRAGWRLLDYAGPRRVWTEHEQELDVTP